MPRRAGSPIIACALGCALATGVPAAAAEFEVVNTDDTGVGSLRDALTQANASADASNTIVFDLEDDSTIMLGSALPVSQSGTLILDATDSPGLVIEGPFDLLTNDAGATSTTLRGVSTGDATIGLDGHELSFDEAGTGTLGNVTGNDVRIIKTGVGTTTLSSGRTVVLMAPAAGDRAELRIDQGIFAVEGDLGAEALLVETPGFLDVTGSVSTGTLTGRGDVLVHPGGTLTAPGGLSVETGATLTADGVVDATGGTVSNRGTLLVNDTLMADTLIVEPEGVLTGDSGANPGVVSAVTVRGRVAPATPTGMLRVEGPVAFEAGSVFEVDMAPGNAGDTLEVQSGAVTIAPGAILDLRVDPDAFAAPSTVEVLSADGGITGQFAVTDLWRLDEQLDYQPNLLRVTLMSVDAEFSSVATTPNQTAVAQMLDALVPTASGDFQAVLDALDGATASEIPPLLDAIGGEALTAFATGRQILGERTARALHRRTRDAAWGDGSAVYASRVDVRAPALAVRPALRGPLAAGGTPLGGTFDVAAADDPLAPAAPPDPTRAGAWLDGFGLYGELEGDPGEADVETILYGGTLGLDVWVAERLLLGLAAGYARSDLDADERDAELAADTIQGALYAGFTDPRGYLSAYGRYAYSFQDATREIESTGLSRHARADFDAQDWGAGAEAGITVLSFGRFALQPIAGVDWLRLHEESYTEKSAGSLSLDVDPEDLESVTGRFGGRLFGRIEMEGAGLLVPELRAFWQREFGDTERVLDARLVGGPGLPAAGVRGPEMPRDVILLGVGWSASVNELVQVLADYDALLDRDRVEHQGNLAVRLRF